jgi:hypothetical protein
MTYSTCDVSDLYHIDNIRKKDEKMENILKMYEIS